MDRQPSTIPTWYTNKTILITGATGFMGKILVEKLLRSCPDLETIYLLVRPKRGREPSQRLEDFVNAPIFDRFRDSPNGERLFEKLKCIGGDVTQRELNLTKEDVEKLRDEVDVVFHMAANVRFDQPLKSAVLMNTGGTRNVLDFVVTLNKLKAFIHVSTSYCHCDETKLEERLYQAPHSPKKMLDLVSWLDEDLLKLITPKLLKSSPNTYAYTKCLTEQLVSEYATQIPVLIARPSIVTAAWKEPIAGWVDNLNGPTGLLVGAGMGVIRTMYCNAELDADVIPVDVAINRLIVAAWKLGSSPRSKEPLVYNITGNKTNALSWGDALTIGRKHVYDNPFSVCLWYPGGSIKSNYILHVIAVFFFHIIPAYCVDFILTLTRNKPFLVRTQKRIQNGLKVLQYYTTRPWYFHNEKLERVFRELSEDDREIFYSNMETINWNQYILEYILGCRKYCIHEEPDTIPYARKMLKRLYYLDVVKNILLCALVLWFLSLLVTKTS